MACRERGTLYHSQGDVIWGVPVLVLVLVLVFGSFYLNVSTEGCSTAVDMTALTTYLIN